MATQNQQQLISDLFQGLKFNMKLSEEILQVLKDESIALRDVDTQGLFRLSKEKSNLLVKVQYLDDSIKKTINELQPETTDSHVPAHRNGPLTSRKLSWLEKYLSPEQAQVVRSYRQKLAKLRDEIMAKNLVNKQFTKDTLGYLGDAISLLTGPARTSRTYGSKGLPPNQYRNLPSLISKEV